MKYGYWLLISFLPEIANFGTEYFKLSNFYIGEDGIKQLYIYHGLYAHNGDNPLTKACRLSPCTGRQTMA